MNTTQRTVVINKGTTALTLLCNGDGRLSEAPAVSMIDFLKTHLTEYEFNYRFKTNIQKYSYFRYNRATGYLHIPVHILGYLINYFRRNMLEYQIVEVNPTRHKHIHLCYSGGYEDREEQLRAIEFLSANDTDMKTFELQTGKGKTFIAVRTIIEIGKRALVTAPASLIVQWNDALSAICDAKVAVIRGKDTVLDLITSGYQNDFDIFLGSIDTLREYAGGMEAYESLPTFCEFLEGLGIGTKVTDEYHLNFNANTIIDIHSNVKHNLYLSATHLRTSKNSNNIFKKIYPQEIKYKGAEYTKYINTTEIHYSLGQISDKYVTSARGWNQFKYEKLIMNSLTKFTVLLNKVIHPVVERYYIEKKKDGQKLLFLVGMKDFVEIINQWFTNTYPDLTTISFLYGTPDEEIEKADVIVSTIGSCGTGRNIVQLKTMIVFVSFGSEVLAHQTMGRLRRLKDDTPEFIYLVNSALEAQKRHAKIRQPIYREISKEFKIVDL